MSVGKESIPFWAGSVTDISDTEDFTSEKLALILGLPGKAAVRQTTCGGGDSFSCLAVFVLILTPTS